MKSQAVTTILTYVLLCVAGIVSISLPDDLAIPQATAQVVPAPLGRIVLQGVVRDFTANHPDFGPSASLSLGPVSKNVAPALDQLGRPSYTGMGRAVTSQWIDKDLNPIQPYGDRGLFGGHFDVDVFDVEGSTSKIYHEHQFDDKYNVTYVDIANDLKLLYDVYVGPSYPGNVRVTLSNVFNGGGGTFTFQAAGPRLTGMTANGFTTIFNPADLTEFRINFVSLADMRQTEPGISQSDGINRDNALRIRIYDVISNVMIYELVVYNHFKPGKPVVIAAQPPMVGNDACGVPFNDTVGTYGAPASGGVTSGDSFSQWFRNDPLANVAMTSGIELTLDAQGVYSFSTNSFYPADNQLFGNGGAANNNFFTYSISTTFTYRACGGQFFEFAGSDDAWVYINGQLVLDIGGIGNGSRQFVALDRLNLVDGQVYPLDFFYAQRRETPNSMFNMRTNIQLRSAVPVNSSGLSD